MRANMNDQIRSGLQNDLRSLNQNQTALTNKIRRLQLLTSKVDQILHEFESNRAQFRSLYNPRSEWDGEKRRMFDQRMDSETLAAYRSFLTSVHHLKEDIQDEVRSLNSRLNFCQSDIRSIYSRLDNLSD